MFRNIKFRKGVLAAIIFITVILTGCYSAEYTSSAHAVDCNWKKVNKTLKNTSPEEFGLYAWSDNFNSEKENNYIVFENVPLDDDSWKTKDTTYLSVLYGAVPTDVADSDYYYRSPTIKILMLKYPEEESYYIAKYNLGGALLQERGEWFLEEDKGEYCGYYVDAILEMIGKK